MFTLLLENTNKEYYGHTIKVEVREKGKDGKLDFDVVDHTVQKNGWPPAKWDEMALNFLLKELRGSGTFFGHIIDDPTTLSPLDFWAACNGLTSCKVISTEGEIPPFPVLPEGAIP